MQKYLLDKSKTLKDALKKLEKIKEKCLLITRSGNILAGTVTDGDIRRAIFNGANVKTNIYKFAKKNPVTLRNVDIENSNQNSNKNFKLKKVLKKSLDDKFDIIPVIDKKRIIKKIIYAKNIKNYFQDKLNLRKIPVLIMAGGRGTRLKEFTNYFPKPLVPVQNSTALEYIINMFKIAGSSKFFISLNYKKNLIKSYLKENKVKNVNYLEEKNFLGTAGAIGMLNGKVKSDFFVINCDTILSINLKKFYDFHRKNNYKITLAAASKNFNLPYGSCETKSNGQLKKITEKPNINYLINVGLYLIKPDLIKLVKKNKFLGMDAFIKIVQKRKGSVGVYPINEESWKDVGQK